MGPDPRPSHLAHSLTLTPITDKKVKLQETPELTGCEHEKFGIHDLKRLLACDDPSPIIRRADVSPSI